MTRPIVARNAGYLAGVEPDAVGRIHSRDQGHAGEEPRPAGDLGANRPSSRKRRTGSQAAVAKLVAATKGDEAAAKAAIGEVGKACGACHENFRAEVAECGSATKAPLRRGFRFMRALRPRESSHATDASVSRRSRCCSGAGSRPHWRRATRSAANTWSRPAAASAVTPRKRRTRRPSPAAAR